MDIFISSFDPKACAEVMDDVLLNRMLSEAIHCLGLAAYYHTSEHLCPIDISGKYRDDLCVRWVRRDRKHYKWLLLHARSLCNVFESRSGYAHHDAEYLRPLRRVVYDFPEVPLLGMDWQFDHKNCVRYDGGVDLLVGALGVSALARPWYWPNTSGHKTYSDRGFDTYTTMRLGIKIWPQFTVLPCALYQRRLLLMWASQSRWRWHGEWIDRETMVSHAKEVWQYGNS